MVSIFHRLIDQLNSSVFVLLGILSCTGWMLCKIGKWTAIFKHHDEKIVKIEGLAEKVVVMGTKADLIYQLVNPNRAIAAMSPLSLTDVGKQIVENIKAHTILEKCFPILTKEVQTENPGNAYDIQLAALKIAREKMLACLNEEELISVKHEAYNRGLLIEDIMSVFGVLLRDRILSEKRIPISEVDRHAP